MSAFVPMIVIKFVLMISGQFSLDDLSFELLKITQPCGGVHVLPQSTAAGCRLAQMMAARCLEVISADGISLILQRHTLAVPPCSLSAKSLEALRSHGGTLLACAPTTSGRTPISDHDLQLGRCIYVEGGRLMWETSMVSNCIVT